MNIFEKHAVASLDSSNVAWAAGFSAFMAGASFASMPSYTHQQGWWAAQSAMAALDGGK